MELILLILLLVLFGWSSWIDSVWIAAVGFVIFLAGTWLHGDLSLPADPATLLALGVFSLAIGAAWSLWKWRRWIYNRLGMVYVRITESALPPNS